MSAPHPVDPYESIGDDSTIEKSSSELEAKGCDTKLQDPPISESEPTLNSLPEVVWCGRPGQDLDLSGAVALKRLLLGSALLGFEEDWRGQSLSFGDTSSELAYGLQQNKVCEYVCKYSLFIAAQLL